MELRPKFPILVPVLFCATLLAFDYLSTRSQATLREAKRITKEMPKSQVDTLPRGPPIFSPKGDSALFQTRYFIYHVADGTVTIAFDANDRVVSTSLRPVPWWEMFFIRLKRSIGF